MKKKNENRKVIQVSVPTKLYDRLYNDAMDLGISLSSFCCMVFNQKYEQKDMFDKIPEIVTMLEKAENVTEKKAVKKSS